MVRPLYRSRSMARKKRNTPGNRNTIIYRRRNPSRAKCALCGATLGGVPAKRPAKMKKIPKVSKRPERQYGGRICHNCLKSSLVEVSKDL
ncbi:MAG: 50S ribosomal protein L34e [Candidatus Lokiarchaeota archaeon]|nr:50S ribosomal protein L34e [Candidatus Lokiarchaeota archaeon]